MTDKMKEHKIFMKMLLELTEFSKCQSKQVACILVRDKSIISSGVNGTPAGAENCCDLFDASRMHEPDYREEHHAFSEAMECHAEENAIIYAAVNGNSIRGTVAYVSMKPCERCLKMLVSAGIREIYYHSEYDKFVDYKPAVNRMIKRLNVMIVKINPI